jgi:hypothetical protein
VEPRKEEEEEEEEEDPSEDSMIPSGSFLINYNSQFILAVLNADQNHFFL